MRSSWYSSIKRIMKRHTLTGNEESIKNLKLYDILKAVAQGIQFVFFLLSISVSLALVFFLSSTQIRLFRKDSWCISILRGERNELCHSFIFLTNAKIWNFLLRSAFLHWRKSFGVSSCLFLVTLNFKRIKAVVLICTWSCEYINCLQKYSQKCALPSWNYQFLFSNLHLTKHMIETCVALYISGNQPIIDLVDIDRVNISTIFYLPL